MKKNTILKIENLEVNIKDKEILKGINLEIKEGEVHALMGTNGAGKSTLLRCINGLESYDDGLVNVMGNEVKSLNKNELRVKCQYYDIVNIHNILPTNLPIE